MSKIWHMVIDAVGVVGVVGVVDAEVTMGGIDGNGSCFGDL